jgi:alpha-beta hydrolase superfamily lysophospholipase
MGFRLITRTLLTFPLLLCLAACMQPQLQRSAPDATRAPALNPAQAVMADGYSLPLSISAPDGELHAMLLALHGFNDYRNAFNGPARVFARHGIMTVAYDQRGFGATVQRGLWAGQQRMQQDALTVARLLCTQHPGVPLYLLGESMGGAVVLELLHQKLPDCVAGAVLVAPAIWGWQTMPWWQGLALRVAVHLFPATTVTGKGLHITPSDNREMLLALGRDPLVIKETRIDTIYGLTNLMDAAYRDATRFPVPVLLLYGEHDQIIPPEAMCAYLHRMPGAGSGSNTLALYPDGYHMLTRDLRGQTVLKDIVSWVDDRTADLPSGKRVTEASERLVRLCDRTGKPAAVAGYADEN